MDVSVWPLGAAWGGNGPRFNWLSCRMPKERPRRGDLPSISARVANGGLCYALAQATSEVDRRGPVDTAR